MLNEQKIIHKIQDDYDLSQSSIYRYASQPTSLPSSSYHNIQLVSNLIDESLNIYHDLKYVTGNHKPLLEIIANNSNERILNDWMGVPTKEGNFYHYSKTNISPLKKLKTLNFSLIENYGEYANTLLMANYINYDKAMSGSFQDLYRISTLKEIHFKSDKFRNMHQGKTSDAFDITKKYNDMILIPRALDVERHNLTLFDIYLGNESGKSSTFDHTLDKTKISYKSSAIGTQKMNIGFFKTNESQKIKIDNGREMNKIGEFRFIDNSYYDYEKKRTMVGLNSKSKIGELVPYNYEGLFSREIIFEPNASKGPVTIRWEEDISTPLLDPYYGLVRLEVENGVEEEILELVHLNKKHVKTLRDRIKEENDAIPSLEWFKRNSNA